MNLTEIKQNKIPVKPDLRMILTMLKQEIMMDLNCHAIAKVENFDPIKKTVKATIQYQKTINDQHIDYPVLMDCPVIVLSGGLGRLTFPIKKGDNCLVLFNDRDINAWFASGMKAPLMTPRTHAFADGVALVGLGSLIDAVYTYDQVNVKLSNGTTAVKVGPTNIELSNAVTTLGTQMSNLMTQLTTLTSVLETLTTAMSTATPGTVVAQIAIPSGVAAAAIVPVITSLSVITTQLEGLLA